ncbi:hypothetical protein AB1Y20_023196 [Prymnesium parvum]|uniref:Inosine/uridine-preferring nucleoside hydrolase domain-containing protein n=1 Tax=Prymnesium parvum TaxID=97485 RepID=A0AB34JDP3_PRYPA
MLLGLALLPLARPPLALRAVPLIIDTDIGGGGCRDVDDVGAICVANALADNGEAELLAIVQNTRPSEGAGVISVLNHWYGRDKLPIGAYREPHAPHQPPQIDPTQRIQKRFWDGDSLLPDPLSYVPDLVSNWPSQIKNSSQVDSAVDVYRRVLASQPDHAVVISSIGLLTNLEALLQSGPDGHSRLNGYDLFSRKVRLLSVMGGRYPNSSLGCECNFCAIYNGGADHGIASRAAAYVIAHLPPSVQVIYSGVEVGLEVQSGGRLSDCAPPANPCRQAYIDYEGGPRRSRYSWDPLTTLAAVRGVHAASCRECKGCDGFNMVNGTTGDNSWSRGTATNQSYLVLTDAKAAGEMLDQLMCQPPKRRLS